MMFRWVATAVVVGALFAGCGDNAAENDACRCGRRWRIRRHQSHRLPARTARGGDPRYHGVGHGDCALPVAAENIAAMLTRSGLPRSQSHAAGRTPLEGSNAAPQAWRNVADTLGGVDLPEAPDLSDASATELLTETISGAGDVVLIAYRPLTNIAEAIDSDPTLVDHIEMLYLMGGAVDVGGNVLYANPDAEFNIWADPHAAAMVFATDIPITMIPLDATNALPVTPYLYEAVAAHRDASPVAAFMADYLDATPLQGGMHHWDELAAVAATDESVATIDERLLEVVETGGPSAGATVVSDSGRPVRVAVEADVELFERTFYEAILGTSETGIPEWEPDATLSSGRIHVWVRRTRPAARRHVDSPRQRQRRHDRLAARILCAGHDQRRLGYLRRIGRDGPAELVARPWSARCSGRRP